MLAAIEKMAGGKESPAAVSPDLATAKIRVVRDTPGKEPVEGATVTMNGKAFSEEDSDLLRKTDVRGVAEFGPVRPGKYTARVTLANGLQVTLNETIYAGKTDEQTVLTPVAEKANVSLQADLPEDLRHLGLGFRTMLHGSRQVSDGMTWGSLAKPEWSSDAKAASSGQTSSTLAVRGPTTSLPAPNDAGKAAAPADDPGQTVEALSDVPYKADTLDVFLPPALSKPKVTAVGPASPATSRLTLTRKFDAANAPTFEAKAGGPNDWHMALPADLIEELRFAVADAKFLPSQPPLDTDLANALPAGQILRIAPLDKTVSVSFWKGTPGRMGPGELFLGNCGTETSFLYANGGTSRSGLTGRCLLGWPDIPSQDVLGTPERQCFLAFFAKGGSIPKDTTAQSREIQLFAMTSDWSETSATWKNQPATEPQPTATAAFSDGPGWKVFDVTGIVKAQAEGERKSLGVLMRFREELAENAPNIGFRAMAYCFEGRVADPIDFTSMKPQKRPQNGWNEWNVRPVLVIVDPEAPGAEGITPIPPVTASAQATLTPSPDTTEAESTREQRLERRKEELRALVEQRKAEAAAQMGGADRAK
jgi:hypothetical protein